MFTGQQWRNRHRESTYGHGERRGEDEMYGKNNLETYITICKIDSQQKFSVWLRKLKQGLYINLEGWVIAKNVYDPDWYVSVQKYGNVGETAKIVHNSFDDINNTYIYNYHYYTERINLGLPSPTVQT